MNLAIFSINKRLAHLLERPAAMCDDPNMGLYPECL